MVLRRLHGVRLPAAGSGPGRVPPQGAHGLHQGGRRCGRWCGSRWPWPSTSASTSSCCTASRRTRGSWRCPGSTRPRPRAPRRCSSWPATSPSTRSRWTTSSCSWWCSNYFAIPTPLQHRVLFFGILGALVFRAIFIALGAHPAAFQWVVWIFGAFLVFTGVRMMFAHEKGWSRRRTRWSASSAASAGHAGAGGAQLLQEGRTGCCTPRRSSSPCSSWR